MHAKRLPIIASLLALYLIWGSTYYAIRIGVETWPPLMMAGVRFLLAGGLLLLWTKWRGQANPTRKELGSAAVLGLLMPAIGNGFVTMAETQVSSGVAALMVATVPLFITLCAHFMGQRTRTREWLALCLGFCGIVVLNQGSTLAANPRGAILLILACLGWALGSVLSRKLPQAPGFMASALMMTAGGLEMLLGSFFYGEHLSAPPSVSGWLAMLYLAIFGSVIALNAYLYLLKNVSSALATSYAYVNPVIAVLLGMGLLSEHVGTAEWCGMGIILLSVLMIVWRRAS